MSTQVITGESTWSLEQVAKVMAEHQIRRLPIIQDGKVAGIVSLGDVAVKSDQTSAVAKSLQAISAPIRIAAPHRSARGGPLIDLMLAALATSVVAWLTWNHSGQTFRKQVAKTDLYHTAQHTLGTAREKVAEAASSKEVRNARRDVDAKINEVRRDVDARLNDLAAQLPTVTYKPAKSKHGLFA
jgi:CBS-domain-containing membrane protein